MFIEKLSPNQQLKLLEAMKIHPNENIKNCRIEVWRNRLRVFHGNLNNEHPIMSIYSDFKIEKIYNASPSAYDQKKYQNFMSVFLGKEYADSLKTHLEEAEKEE